MISLSASASGGGGAGGGRHGAAGEGDHPGQETVTLSSAGGGAGLTSTCCPTLELSRQLTQQSPEDTDQEDVEIDNSSVSYLSSTGAASI